LLQSLGASVLQQEVIACTEGIESRLALKNGCLWLDQAVNDTPRIL